MAQPINLDRPTIDPMEIINDHPNRPHRLRRFLQALSRTSKRVAQAVRVLARRALRLPRQPGPRLDGAALVATLKLLRQAEEDALHERPATDSRSFPALMDAIFREAGRRTRQRSAVHVACFNQIRQAMERLHVADPERRVLDAVDDFEAVAVEEILLAAHEEQSRLAREARRAEIGLNVFQSHHRISRPVKYPRPFMLSVALAAIAVVGEALVNGQFLKDASPSGLLAGWLYAGGFAAGNVTLSSIAGATFARWSLLRPVGLRTVLGWTGLVGFTGFIFTAHSLFVAFRTIAEQSRDFAIAASEASGLLVSDPLFWLNDLGASSLMVVGLAISAASVWKAMYAFSDPFPGYLAAHTRVDDARSALDEMIGSTRDDIDAGAEAVGEEIDSVEARIDDAIDKCLRLRATLAQARASRDEEHGVYEEAINQALAIYWTAQREFRQGLSPLPDWVWDRVEVPEIEYGVDPDDLEARIGALEAHLRSLRDRNLPAMARARLAGATRQAHRRLNAKLADIDDTPKADGLRLV